MTEQGVTAGLESSSDKENDTVTGTELNEKEIIQEERNFSQADVDKIVQARLEKYKKRFSDIDLNEYKTLKSAEDERELEAMKKREEFDQVLGTQKAKYEEELNTLRTELTTMKVDGTLLAAAGNRNAVNPEQVSQLLRNQVGLDETGRPVVYTADKQVVYDPDTSEPKTLESLVNEFLDANTHFVRSGARGVVSSGSQGSDLSKGNNNIADLDMNKPADRKIYKELMSSGKLI
ncbi:MAG: hypothetical protein CMK92_06080 [Pseudomonas sp.]|jgi:hypothetical protein|nr:hypothetical protein [Pseudomonas sp.]